MKEQHFLLKYQLSLKLHLHFYFFIVRVINFVFIISFKISQHFATELS